MSNTRTIYLFTGEEAIVDANNYEYLNSRTWYMCDGYASTFVKVDGKYKTIKMHRVIMGEPEGFVIDHINRNTLDNRIENLRVCSVQQNSMNKRKISKPCTSKYKGVTYRGNKNCPWEGYIYLDNVGKYIGSFTTEVAAANAYNHYAKIYHGEFAKLNDVEYMSEDEWREYMRTSSSSYYGVCWAKESKKWRADIKTPEKKRKYIGIYENETDAALAYNKVAIELYGENYSKLNRISESNDYE